MDFRTTKLYAESVRKLFGVSQSRPECHGALRRSVDRRPGCPDRIELRDPDLGEPVLLVSDTHVPVTSTYRSSYASYVREGACSRYEGTQRSVRAIPFKTLLAARIDQA